MAITENDEDNFGCSAFGGDDEEEAPNYTGAAWSWGLDKKLLEKPKPIWTRIQRKLSRVSGKIEVDPQALQRKFGESQIVSEKELAKYLSRKFGAKHSLMPLVIDDLKAMNFIERDPRGWAIV
mgnify:CR=1 FL=1